MHFERQFGYLQQQRENRYGKIAMLTTDPSMCDQGTMLKIEQRVLTH